ncbi:MAG: ABC transporter substrate-binding protein [Thermodesulfobacteriota bacterium]
MERRLSKMILIIFLSLLEFSIVWTADPLFADPPAERKVRKIEFAITTPGYDPIRHDWCVLIAENWKKLGIDVEIKPVDTSVMISQGLNKHDFDAMVLSWGGIPERIDPDYFIFTILDSSQAGEGRYNMDGYNNPEYDKWARKQRVTIDPEERRKAVFKAQEIFARDQPETPVVHQNYIHAYNSADFDGAVPMMGEGLNSRWNFVNIRPKGSQKLLRYGHPEDVKTLNPMKVVGLHELAMFRVIYDQLMALDPEGKVIPWAAKEAKIVNDRTVDVTLREGMTFHDGKPVTADDIKFTFDYLRKWKIGPFVAATKSLDSIEKTGYLSVRFKLNEPDASFLGYALSYVYILPKHVWENIPEKVGLKSPEDWTDWKALVIGSGPFKYEYWRRGEEMKLVRHEGHFSKPKIEGILRIVFGDMQGLVMALQKKEIDVVGWNLSPLQAKTLKSNMSITVVNVPNHGFYPIHYNCRKKPFDDVAFRRALAYCVPKKRIVEEFHEGYAVEAQSTIGPMNGFWHNPNVEKFDLALEKARKTLKDAGYEWDSKGKLYYPKGK